MKASIASMSHQKLNLFLMQLSFLGWSILISLVSNMALFMLGNVLNQVLYLGLNLALSVYMNCSLCAFIWPGARARIPSGRPGRTARWCNPGEPQKAGIFLKGL